MCGIAGFWDPRRGLHEPSAVLRAMAETMVHRGPDASGEHFDPDAGLGLAHRRLSILDLTVDGAQPMTSADGRWVIAYNGEVYNFPDLRRELEALGAAFRGRSDTEVLLAAVAAWGLASALERCNGMFAFALWDRRERRLHLVRDRLGIKPLYYGWVGGVFAFASEPAAIAVLPGFPREVDPGALGLFLRHSYVPAPHCIWRNLRKLAPGHRLELAAPAPGVWPEPRAWWRARDAVDAGARAPFAGTAEEAVDALESLLLDAVGRRLVSDVPLGAFLSGGIDSSLVVSLMQERHAGRVRTFSIGFPEEEFDEAPFARAVAAHLGTEHTELEVTGRDSLEVVPRLPAMFSEPFADSSQIPTFLVSQLARRHVTVSLSGDGGDELFAGYRRYGLALRMWRRLHRVRGPLAGALATVLRAVPARTWDAVARPLRPVLGDAALSTSPGDRLHKLAGVITGGGFDELYLNMMSHWKNPSELTGVEEPATMFTGLDDPVPRVDRTERMTYRDLVTYLPDDILTKVDRASMAVGLEARVPLLDHRVVEFAWSLPLGLKVRDGRTKWLLRRLLDRHVPAALIERPKKGFGVPLETWLRGPLRDWAEHLLDRRRLAAQGLLAPDPVRRLWRQHLSGEYRWQFYLWDVLMFQAWLDEHGRAP
jgi:asparagine synthase (glutamine-hydrolysing)